MENYYALQREANELEEEVRDLKQQLAAIDSKIEIAGKEEVEDLLLWKTEIEGKLNGVRNSLNSVDYRLKELEFQGLY